MTGTEKYLYRMVRRSTGSIQVALSPDGSFVWEFKSAELAMDALDGIGLGGELQAPLKLEDARLERRLELWEEVDLKDFKKSLNKKP